MAFIGASFSAMGLESIGFAASKQAIKNPNILTIGAFMAYIIIGGGTLFLTDINHGLPLITASAFLLTAISYGLYGMNQKETNADTNETDKEQLAYDRKQEEKQTRFENKLRVEKLKGLGGGKTNDRPVTNDQKTTFGQLTDQDKDQIANMTKEEVLEKYPTIKDRTARRWINKIKEA